MARAAAAGAPGASRAATAAGALAAAVLSQGLACGGGRDVVPASRDVRVAGGSGPGGAGYAHVARRPLGVVALAEASGLDPAMGSAAVDRLADTLDACATELGQRGKLVPGAARVTAAIDHNGAVGTLALTTSPGSAVRANALLCLVSPMKLLSFPTTDDRLTGRVLVVEATWGTPEGPSSGDGGAPTEGGPRG